MSETLKGMVEALRTHRLFAVYTALVALIVLLAIFAPYLAPQDPMEGDMKNVLQTPSAAHWLGTDKLGRDTFSRIVAGTQVSLFMTLCLVLLVAVVGSVVGIVSGYFGGKVERVLMRFADMMLAFPGVVLAAGIFAGCGGGGNSAGDTKTLKVGVTNFADTLDPLENYFAWVVVRYGLGESLTKFDEKMDTQPWLAESWSVADDKLTWTFKIRDGVKFSNGDPLTAEAVKSSIELVFEKVPRAKTFFEYDSITADGQTLTIKTKTPQPGMPGYLADPLFLIVDTKADEGRDVRKEGPICTGPYMVESFVKEKAVMKKNPNYWDGDVPFETVEVDSIDDPNTRAMALQSGDVDMAVNIAAGDMDVFRGNDKFEIKEISSLRDVLARLNQKPDHILSDPKVRAALISGCDRESYNQTLLRGTFITGSAPVPPSLDYGFDQMKDPNSYNPERAAKLLD